MKLFWGYCLGAGLLMGGSAVSVAGGRPVDKQATRETVALYKNLQKAEKKHILFGHQHATEYGHGWSNELGRSDVKSVTGSNPAVVGVDFSGLSGRPPAAIERTKEALRQEIADTYNRGGITTVAWHFTNPVTPQTGFYWKDSVSAPAVAALIPGGSHHEQYKAILQTVGGLANSITGKDGKRVPMIFRPYHEFDGGWFWWGKPHCKREDFVALWQFTVSYLRDSLQVHNFIYAFSPDCTFKTEAEYLDRYPGDAWVDLVGMGRLRRLRPRRALQRSCGHQQAENRVRLRPQSPQAGGLYRNRSGVDTRLDLVDRDAAESPAVRRPVAGLRTGLAQRQPQ